LLLERLGKLLRACLHLLKQPDIVDRDHRLVGEGGYKFDLLLGKRLDLGVRHRDDTDDLALAQEWDAKRRSYLADPVPCCSSPVRVGQDVWDLDRLAFERNAADPRAAVRRERVPGQVLDNVQRHPVVSQQVVFAVPQHGDDRTLCLAKPSRDLNDCIQHGLQLVR
jgi:hypothetical protein